MGQSSSFQGKDLLDLGNGRGLAIFAFSLFMLSKMLNISLKHFLLFFGFLLVVNLNSHLALYEVGVRLHTSK